MIEQLLTDLIAAINANTAALKAASATPVSEPEKPKKKKAEPVAPAPEPTKPEDPKPEPAKTEEPAKAPTAPVEVVDNAKPLTIEDLRAVGSKLVAAGKGDELKAVLAEHDAKKLSDIAPDTFAQVHAKLTDKLNGK